MKTIVRAFYNEPVLACGVVLGALAALATADVIDPVWTLVGIGIFTPIQRYFVTPDQP
jgi:hypothetical protein